MNFRIGFLLFAIGLGLGCLLRDYMQPPKKQLDVKVDCTPAARVAI